MDRATRNLLALAAIAMTLGAYGLCGLIGYGILPLLTGGAAGDGPGLLAIAGLAGLLALSAFLGGRALWREAAATRRLRRHLAAGALPMPAGLLLAARDAGLSGRVTVVDSPGCCSFVYGTIAPRVAISSGLVARLSARELRAALEHERYHVERLDPLRSALAGGAARAMFFLPALQTLRGRYEVARELAADRRAIEVVGARPLVGALLKAIEGGAPERPGMIPLAALGSIGPRIAQLETGSEPDLARLGLPGILASILGAGVFLALLVGSALAAGGGAGLSRELGPASLLEGAALCLLPLVGATALGYRRLSIRSARGV
jgi:Zn-dependent protease with chaperone function